MKILELTNYTSGACGVRARVLQEAAMLAQRGHEVRIFSSNLTKGSDEIAKEEENIEGVKIMRFQARKLGGESFMSWRFESEALKFKPDVIIAHAYRHMHTTRALKVAKKINARIFLVTHAPFDRDSSRTFIQRNLATFYDKLIGKRTLKKFNKIIAITKWEIPFLLKLGLKEEKIEYIPNGIKEEFFAGRKEKEREQNKILYMGRVSEIKNLEIMIKTLPLINDKKIIFKVIGPCEKDYLEKLKEIAKENKAEDRLEITNKTYNYREEIKELDSARLFILPSLSEGMPQVLVEAMARGKIVIASDNKGNCDLIEDGKNGFLFKNNDERDLAGKINEILKIDKKRLDTVRKEAKKTAKQFSWDKIIKKTENLINEQNKL